MKRVKTIIKTCGACPEQYEGRLDTGEEFYVRCRWGFGRLDIDNVTTNTIEYPDDPFRGSFADGDLVKLFFEAGIYLDETMI